MSFFFTILNTLWYSPWVFWIFESMLVVYSVEVKTRCHRSLFALSCHNLTPVHVRRNLIPHQILRLQSLLWDYQCAIIQKLLLYVWQCHRFILLRGYIRFSQYVLFDELFFMSRLFFVRGIEHKFIELW